MNRIPSITLFLLMMNYLSAQAQYVTVQDSSHIAIEKHKADLDAQKYRDDRIKIIRNDRARQMALRLTDSLSLTQKQYNEILKININLETQKARAFKINNPDRMIIKKLLQQIEDQRDRFYKGILTEKQFLKYLSSKTSMLSTKGAVQLIKMPRLQKPQ